MKFTAIPNDDGNFDFYGGIVKEFSWRYRSLFGVEGTYNPDARQFVIRIVLAGLTVGITGGISVGAGK